MLEVRNLRVSYGPVEVLHGVSLTVNQGEIVAVLGANGAGKTTLVRAISGLLRANSGSIYFFEEKIEALRTDQILARGIAHVPQGGELFGKMTVLENLELGAHRFARATLSQRLERAYSCFPVLREMQARTAKTLSGGEQRMLAIARGLVASPRLLVLDEPSSGLAPVMIDRVYEAVSLLRKEGVAVLLIEQNVDLGLEFADRGYVMEVGNISVEGTAIELRRNESVERAYIGG